MVVIRKKTQLRRPTRILVLVSVLSFFLIVVFVYPPKDSAACFLFNSTGCSSHRTVLSEELTDDQTISHVVIREVLNTPPLLSKNPKIAFLFMTPGPLPFEMLWHMFFRGHDSKFSVYVHASRERTRRVSRYFEGRDIRSEEVQHIYKQLSFEVVWGRISIVDAERRLLANALLDPDNQHFVLLSESCVPVQNFPFVYNYLLNTNVSFIDVYVDPGPHGADRYTDKMLPELKREEFRKGSQWFTMQRRHAILVMADNLYYTKFRVHCGPNMDGRNCYSDEHYLQSFFNKHDPSGISNWSVTYVDWSERKWHPRSFSAQEVTHELLKNISTADQQLNFLSDPQKTVIVKPCLWNGSPQPCFLFARKFYAETLDKLMQLFERDLL